MIRREPCSRSTTVQLTADGRQRLREMAERIAGSMQASHQPKIQTIADMMAAAKSGGSSKRRIPDHVPVDGMRVATLLDGEYKVVGKVIFERAIEKRVLESNEGFTVFAEYARECVVLNSEVPGPGVINVVDGAWIFREMPAPASRMARSRAIEPSSR